MGWEYAGYIWSAYAAAAVILPGIAAISILRLRRALRSQAALEERLERLRGGDET
ncbi:MAG: heme exporter protein CcmD [Sphingomonadales bacterium]